MATIVTIGVNAFLMAKAADAGAIIKALAGAMPLEDAHFNGKKVWFPSKFEYRGEVSMQTVPDARILNADPNDVPIDLPGDEAAPAQGNGAAGKMTASRRRINGRQQLLIGNGGAA